MNKTVIDCLTFFNKIAEISNFYRYVCKALSFPDVVGKIAGEDVESVSVGLAPFLIDYSPKGVAQFRSLLEQNMEAVDKHVTEKGKEIFRRQCLEATFSIFEAFLRPLLQIYLSYFPQLLKTAEKTLTYVQIVENSEQIIDYLIQKELDTFDHKNLRDKKQYLEKRLNLKAKDIWILNNKELWEDIEKNRHMIVHSDKPPVIDEAYLSEALHYLNSVILKLSAHSQSDHGIPFKWFKDSADVVKKLETPRL
ncbi:MAG: hypothetical protein AAB893_04095 [Patescibacteria group bacterium]